MPLRTLLIDNFDSYTFNLYQYLAALNESRPPIVIRNNQLTWSQLEPLMKHFDNVVVSPGPGRPDAASPPQQHSDDASCSPHPLRNDKDFGVCTDVLLHANIPILGVCLGHQGLAHVYGGKVVHAPEVMHGRLSVVHCAGETENARSLFFKLPAAFKVVRYHSLIAERATLPSCLRVTATTADGIVMGLDHVSKPIYGVQFHPESICTENGLEILRNFTRLTVDWWKNSGLRPAGHHDASHGSVDVDAMLTELSVIPRRDLPAPPAPLSDPAAGLNLAVQRLPGFGAGVSSLACFGHFFKPLCDSQWAAHKAGGSGTSASAPFVPVFWLDSSRVEKGLSRFSFMGSGEGPLSERIAYEQQTQTVCIASCGANPSLPPRSYRLDKGDPSNVAHFGAESFFDFMQKYIQSVVCSVETAAFTTLADSGPSSTLYSRSLHGSPVAALGDSLPFELWSGLVGYVGYEMRSESGTCSKSRLHLPVKDAMGLPDAFFVFCDRLIVFDHETNDVFLVELQRRSSTAREASWLHTTAKALEHLRKPASASAHAATPAASFEPAYPDPPLFELERPKEQYLRDVLVCQDKFREGESYELCLTTHLRTGTVHPRPLDLYMDLRRTNPTPYGAFILISPTEALACSSPERFLTVDRSRVAVSKPIKGTARRGETPEEDDALRSSLGNNEKDFAENLMIVDLIRNDLGVVCKPGSVTVPKLMHVETYATVHQLVTTVCGELRDDVSAVDALQSCFPPGSMTGAPKHRSVEILQEIEGTGRGVYSGTFGYFSLNGAADLSVAIRMVMLSSRGMSIGAGGAIVALSNKQSEFEEMLLKARSPVASILKTLGFSQRDLAVKGLQRDEFKMLETVQSG